MRTCFALTLLLCVAPAAVGQAPPSRYDHFDPVLLNEFALDRIRAGDTTTGWILLERAALLAPHDRRILRNLQEVRAFRAGQASPAADADATAPPAGTVPPEPPPLWPAR